MDADEALRMVNRIYARLDGRRSVFQTREDYYNGLQPLSFATDEWRKANAARYAGFSDNWTRPVVDAEAERLRHTGIKIGESVDAGKKLWEQWLLNEMEMQSSQGFVASLTTSRSFVIVWGNSDDEPLISWEHGSDVEIEYDWANPRERVAALKTWVDESNEYATLYTPDAVWKFERSRFKTASERESQSAQSKVQSAAPGGWEARRGKADNTWPLENPMGVVPVVEVPNRPTLKGDPISEIQGVIPMQDAINLLWAYMFLAADYASMDARVILGQEPPKIPILNENGEKIGEKVVDMRDLQEKRFLWLTGENAKIDSFPSASLEQFTKVIEKAVGHIAAQTRTPPTYLVTTAGMSNVNGEGLKASEIGLVKKTLEFQTFATPALREVYRLVALAMGDKALARQTRLATIAWMNPEIRSEAQLADALVKKRNIGYPFEYILELDGLDPVEVERVMQMREDELNDPQIAAAMRGLDDSAGGSGAVPDAAEDSGGDVG
ncbi:hypothetical protein J2X63_003185 [Agromyces sp. 3263]|uniref:phage portal protein n=1 Tax=Agromyces sp. 3263 TaxID=2817750 RepID=UPI00285D1B03|nr:phage portal protein [Agromyces sp. 3263]MDR6907477.1 hypothetical protein [Agromyces sp. 3263]